MKLHQSLSVAALMISTVLALGNCAGTETQAQLQSQAKVTKDQAQKVALAHVKHGRVKEAELEKENGKLVWSFDIMTTGTKNITEVEVDAITGVFVKQEIETPEKQAEEAAEDAKKS